MPFLDANGEIAHRLHVSRWFRFRAWLRSFFRPAYVRDAQSLARLEMLELLAPRGRGTLPRPSSGKPRSE